MAITSMLALVTLAAPVQYVPAVQAWTFNRLTAVEAVERIAQAGGRAIELYPGQNVSADVPGQKVGPDMSAEATTKLREALTKFGVKAVAFGVTDVSRDEAAARKLFAWAKAMGIGVINTESEGSIDMIEQMVKEFDLKVGFHNHPRQNNNPNYKMWDPNHVLGIVRNRDRRIGACADTGHWVRSGIKPVDALKILKGRVVSSHLKDLNEFNPGARDVPYGTGVSDIRGILDDFRSNRMAGPVSVEYEHWSPNLQVEVGQCLGFFVGYAALAR